MGCCCLHPQALAKEYGSQFRLDYALSREQNNRKGGKMYIQVRRLGPAAGTACALLHLPAHAPVTRVFRNDVGRTQAVQASYY